MAEFLQKLLALLVLRVTLAQLKEKGRTESICGMCVYYPFYFFLDMQFPSSSQSWKAYDIKQNIPLQRMFKALKELVFIDMQIFFWLFIFKGGGIFSTLFSYTFSPSRLSALDTHRL